MTTPLLLITFDNTLAYQDRQGGGTATATGSATYTDGLVDRAFIAQSATHAIVPQANHIFPDQGAIAVRFKRTDASAESSRYIFGVGDFGTADKDWIGARVAQTTSAIQFSTRLGSDAQTFTASGVTAEADTYHTLYAQWSGVNIGVRVDGGDMVTDTRTAPAGDLSSENGLQIGANGINAARINGAVDDLITFDAPLDNSDQDMLFDPELAWTWGMFSASAPRPSRVFVLNADHIGPMRVGRR